MKERYATEAKLKKRKPEEPLRDFGQVIVNLFRRAYTGNSVIVEENSIKAFLDKCGQSEDFRLAVKRTRPNTLQEAVNNSMQEECLRDGKQDLSKHFKPVQRLIFEVKDWESDADVIAEAEGTRREHVDRNNVPFPEPRRDRRDSRETDLRRGEKPGKIVNKPSDFMNSF
ncbi:unnamed protein product [Mytilus edulis]|uniref:Uncharacterized protein n=1 Tax=Mytilus edulis TaxID=6550 RepID=A0A8S3TVN5_MYTED|nr:unnamed protein product [Mytilus edulis]